MVRIQKHIPEKPKGLNFDYSNCDFPWPIIFVVCFLKNIYINYIWTTTKKKTHKYIKFTIVFYKFLYFEIVS